MTDFNSVLKSFLDELSALFPEEADITAFASGFDALVAVSPTMPKTLFREAVGPHAALVTARDEAVFDVLDFPGGIDLGRLWAADLTDGTRAAIWDYLDLLARLGGVSEGVGGPDEGPGVDAMALEAAVRCAEKMTADGVDPSELLNNVLRDVPEDVTARIRAMADECAQKLQSGGASMESVIGDLVASIESMDLTGLERADVSALTGAMGLSPAGLFGAGGEEDDLLKMLEGTSGPGKPAKPGRPNKRKK